MTKTPYCGNPDTLMAYLYDDGDAAERRAFEAHLNACESCAREVGDLRAVRTDLAAWEPPETLLGFRLVRDGAEPRSWRSWLTWPAMPAWAQMGAAALLVGMAVGISGLEVRSGGEGVVVRTRWSPPPAAVAAAPAPATGAVSDAAWRAELAAVEQRLRQDLRPAEIQPAAAVPVPAGRRLSDDEFLARVRDLIDASESRQQRDMALRLAQVVRDFDAQRRADLVRVADGLGLVEGRTGAEVARQRDMLNYLMRVSSQRDPR